MKNSKKILFALFSRYSHCLSLHVHLQNDAEGSNKSGELSGEIVRGTSFTQGPWLESIQKSADEFMEEASKLKSRLRHFHGE